MYPLSTSHNNPPAMHPKGVAIIPIINPLKKNLKSSLSIIPKANGIEKLKVAPILDANTIPENTPILLSNAKVFDRLYPHHA